MGNNPKEVIALLLDRQDVETIIAALHSHGDDELAELVQVILDDKVEIPPLVTLPDVEIEEGNG